MDGELQSSERVRSTRERTGEASIAVGDCELRASGGRARTTLALSLPNRVVELEVGGRGPLHATTIHDRSIGISPAPMRSRT